MPVPSGVAALLTVQHGLVTPQQLRRHGMTGDAVRWQLESGWRLVLPHVIHAGRDRLDPVQRMIAAGLFAGRGAVVTSLAAAAWHGVTAAAGNGSIQVEVPASRNPRSTGFVVVRRTTRPDAHAWSRSGILIASPARAVLRAAAGAGPGDRCRAIVCHEWNARLNAGRCYHPRFCSFMSSGSAAPPARRSRSGYLLSGQ